jgi:hypothetical protein
MPSKTKTRTTRGGKTITKTVSKNKGGGVKTKTKTMYVTNPGSGDMKTTVRNRTSVRGDYGKDTRKRREETTQFGSGGANTASVTKSRTQGARGVTRSKTVFGASNIAGSPAGKVGRKKMTGSSTTSTTRRRVVNRKARK